MERDRLVLEVGFPEDSVSDGIQERHVLESEPYPIMDLLSRSRRLLPAALSVWVLLSASSFWFPAPVNAAAEPPRRQDIPDWIQIIRTNRDRLAGVDSDAAAADVFVTTLGTALDLSDSAATIAAKGLPAKLTRELAVPDITRSAQRLVAALVLWETAERGLQFLRHPPAQGGNSTALSPAQSDWLKSAGLDSASLDAFRLPTTTPESATATALELGQSAVEASQQAVREWWYLKTWKDRVRTLRGQTRLCGTWQWAIHNHQQHHHEQKLSLIFPPPGKEGTGIPGLTEVIVLGDIVYLRWEMDGRTQEDSLLFTKEAQRLEGTFVNSQGGWGSISGKRTATCMP